MTFIILGSAGATGGLLRSIGIGNVNDNAMAKRFFASLGAKLIERNSFEPKPT